MTTHSTRPHGVSLSLDALDSQFHQNLSSARGWFDELMDRIQRDSDKAIWTHLLDRSAVWAQLDSAASRREGEARLPLFGVPFAVKDNIDVAGIPTTVGCPGMAFVPGKTATAIQRLLDAGAVLIGKTNMDQFATGLVGTRSPYGVPGNPFDARYIPGGSSSGSAVAVARGMVSFSLGTDTAGSGRVPAAFNNIIGLKPTRGAVSTAGVFPACRSLDCVSVFALTCGDAARVFRILRGYDPTDPYSRREIDLPERFFQVGNFKFGVPEGRFLDFFGDDAAERKFHEAVDHLRALGGQSVSIDFDAFARTARLLYEGPWVAERYAAVGEFIEKTPHEVLPVIREIIFAGRSIPAVAVFRAQTELESLRAQARTQWDRMDLLLVPNTGTTYTIDQVRADPISTNTNLGRYTNFVNLLDLSAVAVPNGFVENGLPVGVTLIGPAGFDESLLALGDALHRRTSETVGATGGAIPPPPIPSGIPADWVKLAVVGAHLSGQPLNHQLTSRGAHMVRTCRTSSDYRLYALPGTVPPKPGLIRIGKGDGKGSGVPQEVEVWGLSTEAFGAFVAAIPAPLGIGTIVLEDGEQVKSFVCEHYAVAGAQDISEFGGWRSFLKRAKP
jgi:allophanate hydrolase